MSRKNEENAENTGKTDNAQKSVAKGMDKSVKFKKNELVISFENEHEILPKLLNLAQHFSKTEANFFSQPELARADVLGADNASMIVSGCARATVWTATLGDLGLNPLIFRRCIAVEVDQAGYDASGRLQVNTGTRLAQVVFAIQGSPRKPV